MNDNRYLASDSPEGAVGCNDLTEGGGPRGFQPPEPGGRRQETVHHQATCRSTFNP